MFLSKFYKSEDKHLVLFLAVAQCNPRQILGAFEVSANPAWPSSSCLYIAQAEKLFKSTIKTLHSREQYWITQLQVWLKCFRSLALPTCPSEMSQDPYLSRTPITPVLQRHLPNAEPRDREMFPQWVVPGATPGPLPGVLTKADSLGESCRSWADTGTKILFSPECFFWAESVLTILLDCLLEGVFTAWLEMKGKGKCHFDKRGQGKAINKDRLVVYFVFF